MKQASGSRQRVQPTLASTCVASWRLARNFLFPGAFPLQFANVDIYMHIFMYVCACVCMFINKKNHYNEF